MTEAEAFNLARLRLLTSRASWANVRKIPVWTSTADLFLCYQPSTDTWWCER